MYGLRTWGATLNCARNATRCLYLGRHLSASSRSLSQAPKPQLTIQGKTDKLMTLPNVLTMSRIAVTPFIAHYIMSNQLASALGTFTYCCVTDFLDGYIARKYKMKSIIGSIIDPFADKLLMVVTTFALTVPSGPQVIPLPIAGIVLGRDLGLLLSAFFVRYSSMKAKYGTVGWKPYWDVVRYPSVVVKPSVVSKWNTAFQMAYLALAVVILSLRLQKDSKENGSKATENKNSWEGSLDVAFTWLGYLVCMTTVVSGVSYAVGGRGVKFLKSLHYFQYICMILALTLLCIIRVTMY